MRLSTGTFVVTLAAATSLARAGFLGTIVGAENRVDFGTGTASYHETALVDPSNPDPEFPTFALDEYSPSFDIDVADQTITISNFSTAGSWDDNQFNGLIFSDESAGGLAIAAFTGVAIDPSTTMAGLDQPHLTLPRLSFDADHLSLNWAGLDFTGDTVVVLRVGFSGVTPDTSAVPAPTAAPAGAALIATLLIRRRRPVV